jgi:hypothetical protein
MIIETDSKKGNDKVEKQINFQFERFSFIYSIDFHSIFETFSNKDLIEVKNQTN